MIEKFVSCYDGYLIKNEYIADSIIMGNKKKQYFCLFILFFFSYSYLLNIMGEDESFYTRELSSFRNKIDCAYNALFFLKEPSKYESINAAYLRYKEMLKGVGTTHELLALETEKIAEIKPKNENELMALLFYFNSLELDIKGAEDVKTLLTRRKNRYGARKMFKAVKKMFKNSDELLDKKNLDIFYRNMFYIVHGNPENKWHILTTPVREITDRLIMKYLYVHLTTTKLDRIFIKLGWNQFLKQKEIVLPFTAVKKIILYTFKIFVKLRFPKEFETSFVSEEFIEKLLKDYKNMSFDELLKKNEEAIKSEFKFTGNFSLTLNSISSIYVVLTLSYTAYLTYENFAIINYPLNRIFYSDEELAKIYTEMNIDERVKESRWIKSKDFFSPRTQETFFKHYLKMIQENPKKFEEKYKSTLTKYPPITN